MAFKTKAVLVLSYSVEIITCVISQCENITFIPWINYSISPLKMLNKIASKVSFPWIISTQHVTIGVNRKLCQNSLKIMHSWFGLKNMYAC